MFRRRTSSLYFVPLYFVQVLNLLLSLKPFKGVQFKQLWATPTNLTSKATKANNAFRLVDIS